MKVWFNVIHINKLIVQLAPPIVILDMEFLTRSTQVLILVLLLVAAVQTRQVIRAAPGIETTGQYMVVLTSDTSHERFEAITEKVQSQSLSSEIHKIEGQFAKVIVAKLSVDEAHKVSLNIQKFIYFVYMTVCYTMISRCILNLKNLPTIKFEKISQWLLDRV